MLHTATTKHLALTLFPQENISPATIDITPRLYGLYQSWTLWLSLFCSTFGRIWCIQPDSCQHSSILKVHGCDIKEYYTSLYHIYWKWVLCRKRNQCIAPYWLCILIVVLINFINLGPYSFFAPNNFCSFVEPERPRMNYFWSSYLLGLCESPIVHYISMALIAIAFTGNDSYHLPALVTLPFSNVSVFGYLAEWMLVTWSFITYH